jgi:hypothetical protein
LRFDREYLEENYSYIVRRYNVNDREEEEDEEVCFFFPIKSIEIVKKFSVFPFFNLFFPLEIMIKIKTNFAGVLGAGR